MRNLLSYLVRVFTRGGEEPITRAGQLAARPKKERVPGDARGLFVVPEDFNDPLPPEIQRYFEGEDDDSFW